MVSFWRRFDKEKVYIYGAGLTGIAIAEYIRQRFPGYKVIGFVDDKEKTHEYPIPILGDRSKLEELKRKKGLVNVVLGFVYPVPERLQTGLELLAEGFEFPSFVDKKILERYGVSIGRGVIVYDSRINPGVKLGDFVGINDSHIQSSTIGDGVIITPGVFVGAGANIGRGTVLRGGARIMYGTNIGEYCDIEEIAFIGRNARIGGKTTIGVGAMIGEDVQLAEGTCVGIRAFVPK